QNENGVITLYTYDFNGNILSKSGGTVTVIQTFDLLNRMKTWTDGVSSSVYDYNPDNMRRSKTVNGVTTEHVWLGSNIALDRTGGDVVNYIHNIKSDYGWHVFNAHGDVVQLTDDYGTVIRNYDYDPYGNQLIDNDDCKNPFRYNGQYYDVESGYIYLRHRYMDTQLGRFINEDPIFDGWNWYVYAGNNPVMYHDPMGLAAAKIWAAEKGVKYVEKALAWAAATAAGVAAIGLIQANIDSMARAGNFIFGSNVRSSASNPAFGNFGRTNAGTLGGVLWGDSLPNTGEPNSTGRLYNPDGTIKQEREYGPDGRAERDTDYNHGGVGHEFPHTHEWDWTQPRPRLPSKK
ncbi:MAG: RHS repeat-associated core domain-containing protein, partial [Oscillospiraceae bacterium]|nr:RHS repeat-associated core domain-containing protein [Oscillospiraceae bacterium]